MTTLIRQRVADDCGPCCLAMATGRPYEEVIEKIGYAYTPGKGLTSEYLALIRLGYHDKDFICLHNDWAHTAQFFKRFAWRRRALFSVPSLNIPKGFHMIYVDGENIYDPCALKVYESYSQLQPVELVIFRGP